MSLIESNKNLVNEHIQQQFESLKAVLKSHMAKEVAERIQGDTQVLTQVNKRLEGIDRLFDSKLKDEVGAMMERMGQQAREMREDRELNERTRADMGEAVGRMEREQGERLAEMGADIGVKMGEMGAQVEDKVKQVETKVEEGLQEQGKRIE